MDSTYDKLYETTLATDSGVVSITNIPQNYTDLIIMASMRSMATSAGSAQIYIRVNGSSNGADYHGVSMGAQLNGPVVNTLGRNILGGTFTVGNMLSSTALASSFSGARLCIYNYSSNMPKVIVGESGGSNATNDGRIEIGGSHWDPAIPVTSLDIYSSNNNLAAGTTISLYGVRAINSAQNTGPVMATGGETMISGSYKYHVFRNTGTLFVERSGPVEALLVAGGGGGGGIGTEQAYGAASGAGAGGVYTISFNIPTGPVTVLVGAGGAGGAAVFDPGRSGSDSTILSYGRAIGGGHGGTGYANGGNGGSGGGFHVAANNMGFGTAGQGNRAGTSATYGYAGAGGGGAGAVGGDSKSFFSAGDGGNGTNSYASAWLTPTGTGISGYIGGGGGGGASPYYGTPVRATGGLGGGGAGCLGGSSGTYAESGVANTGGGGGGGGATANVAGVRPGGNGGSGLVIIRYLV